MNHVRGSGNVEVSNDGERRAGKQSNEGELGGPVSCVGEARE